MAAVAYQLRSELARVCLPAPERDAYRRLAWVNSLCLLFLLIGVFGAQNKLPVPKHAPPIEQPVPVVVEPLPPPAPVPKPVERPNEEEKPKPQPSVAVTLDTPAIHFAVPTIGTLVVPLSAAPTPPAADLPKTDPVCHAPITVASTGAAGDRPKPPFPQMALQMGQQGTVVLLFTVDDVGAVTSISVNEPSGSAILDRASLDWVKRKWIQPPVNGGHLFKVSFTYRLDKE